MQYKPIFMDGYLAKITSERSKYVRNFTFGVEDSLVSTVGLLSGVASAGLSSAHILITGIVLIFVEAFSMGVGSLLSEQSADEYEQKKAVSYLKNSKAAILMFISYFLSGFIPLSPYLVLPVSSAFTTSIIFSLISLFVLGAISGKTFGSGTFRSGLRMFLIGGFAIALGVMVGLIAK